MFGKTSVKDASEPFRFSHPRKPARQRGGVAIGDSTHNHLIICELLLTAITTTRHSPHLTAGFLVLRRELLEALECATRGARVSGSS